MVEERLQQLEKEQNLQGSINYIPKKRLNTTEAIDLTGNDVNYSIPSSPVRNKQASPELNPLSAYNKPVTQSNTERMNKQNTRREISPTQSNISSTQQTQKSTTKDYPELRGIDVSMQKLIMREIVDNSPGVAFSDIGNYFLFNKNIKNHLKYCL